MAITFFLQNTHTFFFIKFLFNLFKSFLKNIPQIFGDSAIMLPLCIVLVYACVVLLCLEESFLKAEPYTLQLVWEWVLLFVFAGDMHIKCLLVGISTPHLAKQLDICYNLPAHLYCGVSCKGIQGNNVASLHENQ